MSLHFVLSARAHRHFVIHNICKMAIIVRCARGQCSTSWQNEAAQLLHVVAVVDFDVVENYSWRSCCRRLHCSCFGTAYSISSSVSGLQSLLSRPNTAAAAAAAGAGVQELESLLAEESKGFQGFRIAGAIRALDVLGRAMLCKFVGHESLIDESVLQLDSKLC